jgi:hypothetical protein
MAPACSTLRATPNEPRGPAGVLTRVGAVLAVLLAHTACAPVCVNGESDDGECIPSENGDPCNGEWDCNPASVCFSEVCVTEGTLRFSLSWEVNTDLDLHVRTPSGAEISFEQPSADGGYLDVDDCIDDVCRNPDARHVENIVWDDEPPTGTYTAWVVNYGSERSAAYELSVFGAGATRTEFGSLDDTFGATSTIYTFER